MSVFPSMLLFLFHTEIVSYLCSCFCLQGSSKGRAKLGREMTGLESQSCSHMIAMELFQWSNLHCPFQLWPNADFDPANGLKVSGDQAAHKELPQEVPLFLRDDMNKVKKNTWHMRKYHKLSTEYMSLQAIAKSLRQWRIRVINTCYCPLRQDFYPDDSHCGAGTVTDFLFFSLMMFITTIDPNV